MKRTFTEISIAIILLISFASCNKNDNYYSLGKIWITMGLIDTIDTRGYDFVIKCDNGDTLFPLSNSAQHFVPRNKQRVIVNYTILDEVGESDKTFYVKINDLNNVTFKDIIAISAQNTDSLGNDPVNITDIWMVGDMLNIEFMYYGYQKIHFINLGYKTNQKGTIDEPVELEFRHNANSDNKAYYLKEIVTFRMDNIIEAKNDTINFTVNWIGYDQVENQRHGSFYQQKQWKKAQNTPFPFSPLNNNTF